MRRRAMLQFMSLGIAGCVTPRRMEQTQRAEPFSYTVKGSGPVVLAFENDRLVADQLAASYRVIVMDYPPPRIRNAQDASVIESFTPDRAFSDILSLVDTIGSERFAFYGYSFGAVVGLQIAIRTSRLAAFACGGWPLLGAPYQDMPNYEAMQPFTRNFYEQLRQWPEREAATKITCPRLVFAGKDDVIDTPGVTVRTGPLIAEHREELEQMGWKIRLVDGYKHNLGYTPELVVPFVREFFDSVQDRW